MVHCACKSCDLAMHRIRSQSPDLDSIFAHDHTNSLSESLHRGIAVLPGSDVYAGPPCDALHHSIAEHRRELVESDGTNLSIGHQSSTVFICADIYQANRKFARKFMWDMYS
jgi:hypothetical protein